MSKIKEVKLLALDMDGTVMRGDGSVSPHDLSAIREAIKNGVNVTVATGRTFKTFEDFVKMAGITLPAICLNGAELRDAEKTYFQSTLDIKKAEEMQKEALNLGLDVHVFGNGKIYCKRGVDLRELYVRWNVEGELKSEDPLIQFFDTNEQALDAAKGNINKLLVCFYKNLNICDTLKTYASKLGFASMVSDGNKLEIMRRGVNKGVALKKLADMLEVPPKNTMAIGDSENDKAMFEYAGISVAMENASNEAKRAANYITRSNYNDGVAYAIERFIFSEGDIRR